MNHLRKQADAVIELATVCKGSTAALLCYEADVQRAFAVIATPFGKDEFAVAGPSPQRLQLMAYRGHQRIGQRRGGLGAARR